MKLSNVLMGLFLVLSVGFLASALLYSPPKDHATKAPGEVSAYCSEKMKDNPNILCVGKWVLDVNGNCSLVCEGQLNAPVP